MFFLLLAYFPFAGHGQSIEVKKENGRVEGENTTGYQVGIQAPEHEVKTSLSKYLKALGRTKQSGDYIALAQPIIKGKKYSTTLYATTKQIGGVTAAWFGVPPENGEESGLQRDLEKLVNDFGVNFHREKIQLQIDESVRALEAVEKQQLRLVNQNKELNNRIEGNRREKIELEKSLVKNRIELEDLTKKLLVNSKARDSIAVASQQIKKVVEMHRERQKGVN